MHHVKRGAGHMFRETHDAAEGKVFRKRIVHLSHIHKPGTVFAEEFGIHMHDNVIVFGMDHAKPTLGGKHLKHFPDIAEIHHAALAGRGDVGGEDFRGGVAGFNRLAQLCGEIRRQIAFHHDVESVIAGAAIGLPFGFTFRNGAFNGFAMRPAHEIQNAGGAAVKCGFADDRSALGLINLPIRPRDRPKAMRMRVNPARHHDAIARFHHPHTRRYGQGTRCGNGDDFLARYANFSRPNGIGRDDAIALDHKIHGDTPIRRLVWRRGEA